MACRAYSLQRVLLGFLAIYTHRTVAAPSNVSAVLPLTTTAYGTALTAVIQIGGQPFDLLLDTGSSDLWVLGPDWTCHRMSDSAILGPTRPRGACAYGNGTYTPGSTFTPIDDAWLGVHYGAGDVLGTVGRDDVQFGGITLSKQEFGIANATNGPADGFSEGIMGLGYPILSQTHPTNYTAKEPFDLLRNTLPSQTVLLTLEKMLRESYFAFALERTPLDQETAFGGYVSFGALPPVQHTGEWTTVPVEVTETIPAALTGGIQQRTYWTTTVQSVAWNNETFDTPYQAVVDTGNFYFNVPERLAANVAAAFDPPGVYEPDGPFGPLYRVNCNNFTVPADVQIEIGGRMFSIESEDLIYRDSDGKCHSTFAPTKPLQGIELFFLGDHFLRNVVAVFDFPPNEMRFAQRVRNESSQSPASPQPAVPVQVENQASFPRSEKLVSLLLGVLVLVMVLLV